MRKVPGLLMFAVIAMSLSSCGDGGIYDNVSFDAFGERSSFRPGGIWRDTDGNVIQAHGGHIQIMPMPNEFGVKEDKYVWVGEDKTNGSRGDPVSLYWSDDLYNWHAGGNVLRSIENRADLDDNPYFSSLYASYTKEEKDNVFKVLNKDAVIERPKIIYNRKNDNYVIWFHSDGPTPEHDFAYDAGMSGVAISKSPFGPFRLIDRYRLNECPAGQFDVFPLSKGEARDMNLFQDDDGKAYIVYTSENNKTIYISRLNEDYTYLDVNPKEAVHKRDFIRLFPSSMREAPVLSKIEGRYYLITSSTTGWASNVPTCWSADFLFGEWRNDGNPCVGDGSLFAFDTQSTSLFQTRSGSWIYYGDRWNAKNISDSRYVFLPAKLNGERKLTIEWVSDWKYQ